MYKRWFKEEREGRKFYINKNDHVIKIILKQLIVIVTDVREYTFLALV